MTNKIIEVTANKAYKIEAIKMPDGSKHLSFRQMYKKKTSTDWEIGFQGMTLPWDLAVGILSEAVELRDDPATKFKKIEEKEKKSKD